MKERLQAWGDSKVIHIASCFLFDHEGRLLLLQRHTDDLGGGQWGLPGGRQEPGEELLQTIIRELREETSLQVEQPKLLGTHAVHMPHGSVHLTSFTVEPPSDLAIVIDPDEHHAYRWFETAELLAEPRLLWGIPTIMRDFGLLDGFAIDPTLHDGSRAELLDLYQADANSTSQK